MKKILLTGVMLLLTANIASAASVNGDYKGEPVVKVLYQNKELQAEDVPAIIHDGRTMIPIYLMKQMGADVSWKEDTYSVNVTMNNQEKPGKQDSAQQEDIQILKEKMLVKDMYQWLKDIDNALWMYVVNLQQYSDSNTPNAFYLETNYKKLNDMYLEAHDAAQKVEQKLQKLKGITFTEITTNQLKILNDLQSVTSLYKAQISNPVAGQQAQMQTALLQQLQNLHQNALQNIDNTNKIVHEFVLKDI